VAVSFIDGGKSRYPERIINLSQVTDKLYLKKNIIMYLLPAAASLQMWVMTQFK
jgi:hypothetical protein